MKIYTIGHSNHEFDDFVALLQKYGIETLVDARSAPYSRYAPQFNNNNLRSELPGYGISYEFMGRTIGGRPGNKKYLKSNGEPDYGLIARDGEFIEGMLTLQSLAVRSVVCVACSEEDPAKCHRGSLIGACLTRLGVEVVHVRGDGSLESQEQCIQRRGGPAENQLDLF